MDASDLIDLWWSIYNPYPDVDSKDIVSGKRAGLPTSGYATYPGGVKQEILDGNQQTGSCQYWVNGLPAVCKNWNAGSLKCNLPNDENRPTGYGVGLCDMLGRREWCNKYEKSKDHDLEEFVCVAPCAERTGLGKQITGLDNTLSYRPLTPDEIRGYNADDSGVGRCDGLGLGRGDQGPFKNMEDAWPNLVKCNYYRPQQMGFGVYQPRPYPGDEKPGLPWDFTRNKLPESLAEMHDGSPSDPFSKLEPRLPYVFQIYNNRAMYQKCSHWKSKTPAFFEVGEFGANPGDFTIDLDDEISCECEESACNPYKTVKETYEPGLPFILQAVWAEYGGIVCNGAKPECPCYTGKWLYCNDSNTKDGMRISANQLLEIRFWTSNWENKDEYEAHYAVKPGPTQKGYADETTSDIYTFTKWNRIDPDDPNKSEMQGYKMSLCVPAPLHMREFTIDPYVKKEEITYPKIAEYKGTNIQGEGVLFPTLVRELEDPVNYIPEILVIYPYNVKNPWDIEPCDVNDHPEICVHDHNTSSTPKISVVGHAMQDAEIYVINSNLAENVAFATSYMDEYKRASRVPYTKWEAYNRSVTAAITACEESNKGLSVGATTSTGYFHLDDVELELEATNNLYVICRYSDFLTNGTSDAYLFRKIRVESRFWGALITQDHATQNQTGSVWPENTFPERYSPGLSMGGRVNTNRGEVTDVFSVYSLYVFSPTGEDYCYYSYCINEYEEEVNDVEKWVQVGPTGYIWVEVDNIDITYLQDFRIVEASMTYTPPVDKDGNPKKTVINLCGGDPDTVIQLTQIYPSLSGGVNSEESRKTIPPNVVLLKSDKPLPFFNNDWKLKIKYTYRKLDTQKGENVVWPVGLDGPNALNKFSRSPYTIQHASGDTTFTIPTIGTLTTRGSAKVMAEISDENGRIQNAAATKLLAQGHQLGCRSVDIFYKYSAEAIAYDIEPSSGFYTWRGAPSVNTASSKGLRHGKVCNCGDHECGVPCVGPMWYPFNMCSTEDFYNVLNGAAQCTMRITEGDANIALMGSGAVRYGVAEEYRATASIGGNWASACGPSFFYHYSQAKMDGMQFTGTVKKKAKVDEWLYGFYGWSLPPFGNTGRGYVERSLTRDFISFVDFSTPILKTRFEYAPMVFDVEDVTNQYLNCFESPDKYTPMSEPFSCFPMLSNYIAGFVDEYIDEGRYAFDDVIYVIYHGNCSYPFPFRQVPGAPAVTRYAFKNENIIWAWPEYWKPIERNKTSSNGEFKFLDIIRPEYYFDFVKKEHRLITNEGTHTLIFDPATENPDDAEGDVEGAVYPSICLDGEYPRFFNILYDDYDATLVDWKDEAETGEVGGSGGSGEEDDNSNIYERANGANREANGPDGPSPAEGQTLWLHDYDTIFDPTATADPAEDTKAFVRVDLWTGPVYGYFNRGLIARIPKNRLYYLPTATSDAGGSVDYASEDGETIIGVWAIGEFGVAPLSVTIEGHWGVDASAGTGKEIVFSKPRIGVKESKNEIDFEQDGLPDWSLGDSIGSSIAKSGTSLKDKLEKFSSTLTFTKVPTRLSTTLSFFMVRLTSLSGEKLSITKISAQTCKYVRAEETINVWERKYKVGMLDSFPNDSLNADGPDSKTFRDYERNRRNCAQHFPFNQSINIRDKDLDVGGSVFSKTNMVGFTEVVYEDEKLDVTMDSLRDTEREAQKELYEDAYDLDSYDTLDFNGFFPPAIKGQLETINTHISPAGGLKLIHPRVPWENNNIKNMLRQEGTFWQPGGHYWIWGSSFTKTRCYMFGPVQSVYSILFVHYKHGGMQVTLDAGHSYAGWGRLAYYEGKIKNLTGVGLSQEYATTDSLTGAKNAVFQQSK